MLVSDICYRAARACHKLKSPGQTLATADLADLLIVLNQIVDQWSARKAFAYAETFQSFTLTPNHQPHLIGPNLTAPDFAAAIRPVSIDDDGATLILNNVTPNVDQPLNVRDASWWNNQRVKSLTTNVPTDLYYEPDFPNGSLYLWPVPAFAYGLRLRLWSVVNQFASAGATATLAPGYEKALVLSVAEEMVDWWGIPMPADLPAKANRARVAIQIANIKSPRIASADFGASGRKRGGFNYYSGM